MSNQNENINAPLISNEIAENPVYKVRTTTDLLMVKVADTGINVQVKGNTNLVQTQAITHLQVGEKLKLMQCDPFSGDTHATFQTMPDDGLFPLSGVVRLEDVAIAETEPPIA